MNVLAPSVDMQPCRDAIEMIPDSTDVQESLHPLNQ